MMAKNPQLRVRELNTHKKKKTPAKVASPAPKLSSASKYWNVKVYVQEKGVSPKRPDPDMGRILEKYDSLKEYSRYRELLLLQRSGGISELKRQDNIIIQESFVYNGEKIQAITYKADFSYIRDGKRVIEDVKGYDEKRERYLTTKDFVLKWKLLKHKYPDWCFELY